MSRLVRCSLCDGNKHNDDGNPCKECAGLGFFPHWNDRTPAEIEKEITSTESTLKLDTQERDRLLAAEKNRPQKLIAARIAEESMQFWTLKIESLRAELTEARKRYP